MSTFCYQCKLQGLSVNYLEHTIHPKEKIDLVILLDGDEDVLIDRVLKERSKNVTHKHDTWTKETNTMREIISIYRRELPYYLRSRHINYRNYDTTTISLDNQYNEIKQIINTFDRLKSDVNLL